MSMFCYQCQETAGNKGCTVRGVCGKTDETANLQDVLIHVLKGISFWAIEARTHGKSDPEADRFVPEALFATVTNVNFDPDDISAMIAHALALRARVRLLCPRMPADLPDAAVWTATGKTAFLAKAPEAGFLAEPNEDIRSLKALLIYGLKGIAAYTDHAYLAGKTNDNILHFIQQGLAATLRKDISGRELLDLVLVAGKYAVEAMALLDAANTERFGHPEPTMVYTGVKAGPGILISGHDLVDLEELLQQTEGTGINIYTHGEMLPANAYPGLKRYKHLVGNYGTAWFNQAKEFPDFGGPILMTTNCLVRPVDSYRDRLFVTGHVGWPGVKKIAPRVPGKQKDFSPLITMALSLGSLQPRPGKTIPIGYARNTLMSAAGAILNAVKSGAIKRFIVMAGCDGRHPYREYYTEVAKALPKDAVILTAGCAKYKYNMLDLGDIGGIPRVIDAGQCNDSYSLAYIALKLKEILGAKDINDLPISFDVAWYEQKAVCVLLALLHLGFKNIRLGVTLPAFVSPNNLKVLAETFDIKGVTTAEADVAAMMQGK
jgi:hydroxylamine reductase